MIISRSWFGFAYELCTHTHWHMRLHTKLIYGWEVVLRWQTESNSLWQYFGRKQKSVSTALSLFCHSSFVSPIFLLSECVTQSVIQLDFMSLVDCCKVQIVCFELSRTVFQLSAWHASEGGKRRRRRKKKAPYTTQVHWQYREMHNEISIPEWQ